MIAKSLHSFLKLTLFKRIFENSEAIPEISKHYHKFQKTVYLFYHKRKKFRDFVSEIPKSHVLIL